MMKVENNHQKKRYFSEVPNIHNKLFFIHLFDLGGNGTPS